MQLLLFGILFSGVVQGLILGLLLLKGKSTPNKLLCAVVFAVATHLLLVALDIQGLFLTFPHLSRISWILPLLYGPLLFLLTLSIVEADFQLRKKHILYFLPIAIYFVALFPYFNLSGEEKKAILFDSQEVNRADFGIFNHITNYIHIAFVSFSLVTFYRERKGLYDHYSEHSRVKLNWLKQFLWAVLATMLFSLVAFYSKKYDWRFIPVLYPYHFLLVVGLIYWLAYHILINPVRFDSPPEPIVLGDQSVNETKYLKTALSEEEQLQIQSRLEKWMAEKKPYLNSDLTIGDLCEQLQIKRHQLSQVINSEYKKNFYEYVNSFRIAEFKQQALNPKLSHLSILGIALNSGFKSKATFNAVFKKQENLTPSEYIRLSRRTNTAKEVQS